MSTATKESKVVEALTDDAIKKRIALIGRLIAKRAANRDDLQQEIDELITEKAELIQVQIDRLKAQLPQEQE